jgi:signal transduction histidine kinase
MLVLCATWLALRAALPGDGAPWRQDPGFKGGITVDAAGRADASGLRAGDVVVAVKGVPLDRWLGQDSPPRPPLAAGTLLVYRVRRHGALLDVSVGLGRHDPVRNRLARQAPIGAVAVALIGIGVFAVARRPEHPSARAVLVFGAGLATAFTFTAASWEVADVVTTPWLFVVGMAGTIPAFTVMIAALAHLTLTFPSSPAVLERRPWLVGVFYALGLAVNLGVVTGYLLSGRATLGGLQRWYSTSSFVLAAFVLLGLGGMVRTAVRAYRDTAERAKVRVVGLALLMTVFSLIILNVVSPSAPASPWLVAAIFLPLPAAVAAAILRGEFLDIRATLNRALVFTSVTALLLGIYAVVVLVLGAAAHTSGIAATLPATAVVAVAFAPVRGRLQHAIERLLYGDRGQPAQVLGKLGLRLEAALPDEILPAITETVAGALRLSYVGITTASGEVVCERGEPPPAIDAVALVHQGELLRELLVGARSGEHALATADRALLSELAPHIAATVRATTLVTELAFSRNRLAVAREEERATLRHDLHDRLGSRLVGLALQLDTAATAAEGTPMADAVKRAYYEADAALNEVRRLARGLRPADLDELGLVAAVEAAASRLAVTEAGGWRSEVSAAIHLPSLAPAVEAAAYQIVLEAMTNAHCHSGGQRAQVRISVDPSGTTLVIEVVDDGHGLPELNTTGIGLRSMRERAAAVGGYLDVRSLAQGGALVRAELPIHLTETSA